jgi:hypothetical protein
MAASELEASHENATKGRTIQADVLNIVRFIFEVDGDSSALVTNQC